MQRNRIGLAMACVFSLAASASAWALDYPARPVRWIVGYPAGGSTDIVARIIGQWLSERLGQQFIIENKPGAGNNIGTEAVIRAAPDGYTLLLVNPANAINATLYTRLSFNFIKESAPVAGFIRVPNVMEVNPSVPATTVAEFIAYAKANPAKINWATSGNGTSVHLSGELFKMLTGVSLTHVPYRGSAPALTDMISGTVHVMFDNMPSSLPHIQAGKLRALGVTTAKRSDSLPDVPTVGETVPSYEASAFFGMSAPRGTPPEIIDKLNSEINAGLADPRIKARLAELGGMLIAGSPADLNAKILRDAQWRVLKPLVDRGDIRIISDTWTKDWNPTEAYTHMTEAIELANGKIDAVVASNDGTAGGAIQALAEHNLAGKALVSGQDADLAAIIRILDGTQTMTIYKPLGSQAKLAAEAAVALAMGEPVKSAVSFRVGNKAIPAILLAPVVVTKDNVKETVIKDGFQNLETIQKSLPREKWPQ